MTLREAVFIEYRKDLRGLCSLTPNTRIKTAAYLGKGKNLC